MFKLLFALFIIVPLIEIAILIQIGQVIGAAYTIILVIVTAALGVALLKQQGISTLANVQRQLDEGQLPAKEMIEGLILLIAGVLLLTPGFFTDTLGFLALTPAIRRQFAEQLLKHFISSRVHVRETGSGTVIEGEYWETNNRDQLKDD